jgi:hypothetical protein
MRTPIGFLDIITSDLFGNWAAWLGCVEVLGETELDVFTNVVV